MKRTHETKGIVQTQKHSRKAVAASRTRKTAEAKQNVDLNKGRKSKSRAKLKREPKVKRNYKDTMFRKLFMEKENLLSLYNAINGTDYTNVEDLEINTLKNVIYMGYKNDISFVIDFRLHLYEHQASINPNMPLRDLFYVSEILQGITKDEDLYSSALKRIPTPKFLVFYNGLEEMPERWELRLSDAFLQPQEWPELELVVTVLNINLGKNQELMNACKVLRDYAVFVQKMRDYAKRMTLEEAAERTITECLHEDVLAEFLKKHRAEAKHMCRCLYEYDEEKHIREERKLARESGWKEGHEEGWRAGQKEGWRAGQKEGWRAGQKEGWRAGQKEGQREGRKEGREDGAWLKLCSIVIKKLKKNCDISEIADMLEEDESVIRRVCEVAERFAPDYDMEEMMEYLKTDSVV